MRTWVKTYTSIVNDPTYGALTWQERGIFGVLEVLAGALDASHGNGTGNGQLDTLERTAYRIRCDIPVLAEAVEALREAGLIHQDDGGVLYVTRYPELQARAPSDSPEATSARKQAQRHREKQSRVGHEQVTRDTIGTTRDGRNVTSSDQVRTNQNQSEQGDETNQSSRDADADGPSPGPSDTGLDLNADAEGDKALLRAAIGIWEQYEGAELSGVDHVTMLQWAQKYGGQALLNACQVTRDFKPRKTFGGYLRTVLENGPKGPDPPSS